jgi:hypothetical protein
MNRVKQFQAMMSARVEELALRDGMSREDAEAQAQQELVDKVMARMEAAVKASTCSKCGDRGVMAKGLCSVCYHRDLRARARIKTLWCRHCLKPFEASRTDALTCSKSCRMKAYRAAKRLAEEASRNVSEPETGHLRQVDAKNGENGPRAGSTVRQDPPKPFSKMSPVELNALSYEELEAARMRELAQANDARNAMRPHIQASAGTALKVVELDSQRFVKEIQAAQRRQFRGVNLRRFGF